jgi:hypothetical protein
MAVENRIRRKDEFGQIGLCFNANGGRELKQNFNFESGRVLNEAKPANFFGSGITVM